MAPAKPKRAQIEIRMSADFSWSPPKSRSPATKAVSAKPKIAADIKLASRRRAITIQNRVPMKAMR
jgi:hypothetical protein